MNVSRKLARCSAELPLFRPLFFLSFGRIPRAGRWRQPRFPRFHRGETVASAIDDFRGDKSFLSYPHRGDLEDFAFRSIFLAESAKRENVIRRFAFPAMYSGCVHLSASIGGMSIPTLEDAIHPRVPYLPRDTETFRWIVDHETVASISVEMVASKLLGYSFGTTIRVSRASDSDSYRAGSVSIDVHAYRAVVSTTLAMQDSEMTRWNHPR